MLHCIWIPRRLSMTQLLLRWLIHKSRLLLLQQCWNFVNPPPPPPPKKTPKINRNKQTTYMRLSFGLALCSLGQMEFLIIWGRALLWGKYTFLLQDFKRHIGLINKGHEAVIVSEISDLSYNIKNKDCIEPQARQVLKIQFSMRLLTLLPEMQLYPLNVGRCGILGENTGRVLCCFLKSIDPFHLTSSSE